MSRKRRSPLAGMSADMLRVLYQIQAGEQLIRDVTKDHAVLKAPAQITPFETVSWATVLALVKRGYLAHEELDTTHIMYFLTRPALELLKRVHPENP
jgi:hypothetical protein